MPKPEVERRKSPRVNAEFPIYIDTAAGRQKARVRDLSSKGVCFFLPQPIPEMTAVRVDLELPSKDSTAKVTGDGAVVRCRRIASGVEHYEVAVFFTYMPEDGKSVLDHFVRTLGT